jgi:hypothetical protein
MGIDSVTPQDILAGRQGEIHAARDRKLEQAHSRRQLRRVAGSLLAHRPNTATMTSIGEAEVGHRTEAAQRRGGIFRNGKRHSSIFRLSQQGASE